jgi:hypothetical protein
MGSFDGKRTPPQRVECPRKGKCDQLTGRSEGLTIIRVGIEASIPKICVRDGPRGAVGHYRWRSSTGNTLPLCG